MSRHIEIAAGARESKHPVATISVRVDDNVPGVSHPEAFVTISCYGKKAWYNRENIRKLRDFLTELLDDKETADDDDFEKLIKNYK